MPDSNILSGDGADPDAAPAPPGDPRAVTGVFLRPDDVARAVQRLAESSVPTDDIDVYVLDANGQPGRRIGVRDEPGTLRGAIFGAIVGGALGVVVVILTLLDAFGPVGADPLGASSLLGAFRTIGASAAAGVPIGAVIGMGRWQGRKKLDVSGLRGDRMMVVVESDALADTARDVLRDAGAEQVAG